MPKIDGLRKGQVMFGLYTPQHSLLGIFQSRWKACEGKRLWNYDHFEIQRLWVEESHAAIFEISNHYYKRIN